MRSLLLACVLFVSACATTGGANRPVNVASVRSEINGQIQSESGDRTIHSMGKVTAERAVVYTTKKDGSRQDETWVKAAGVWKLETATAVAGT